MLMKKNNKEQILDEKRESQVGNSKESIQNGILGEEVTNMNQLNTLKDNDKLIVKSFEDVAEFNNKDENTVSNKTAEDNTTRIDYGGVFESDSSSTSEIQENKPDKFKDFKRTPLSSYNKESLEENKMPISTFNVVQDDNYPPKINDLNIPTDLKMAMWKDALAKEIKKFGSAKSDNELMYNNESVYKKYKTLNDYINSDSKSNLGDLVKSENSSRKSPHSDDESVLKSEESFSSDTVDEKVNVKENEIKNASIKHASIKSASIKSASIKSLEELVKEEILLEVQKHSGKNEKCSDGSDNVFNKPENFLTPKVKNPNRHSRLIRKNLNKDQFKKFRERFENMSSDDLPSKEKSPIKRKQTPYNNEISNEQSNSLNEKRNSLNEKSKSPSEKNEKSKSCEQESYSDDKQSKLVSKNEKRKSSNERSKSCEQESSSDDKPSKLVSKNEKCKSSEDDSSSDQKLKSNDESKHFTKSKNHNSKTNSSIRRRINRVDLGKILIKQLNLIEKKKKLFNHVVFFIKIKKYVKVEIKNTILKEVYSIIKRYLLVCNTMSSHFEYLLSQSVKEIDVLFIQHLRVIRKSLEKEITNKISKHIKNMKVVNDDGKVYHKYYEHLNQEDDIRVPKILSDIKADKVSNQFLKDIYGKIKKDYEFINNIFNHIKKVQELERDMTNSFEKFMNFIKK